ncbi:fluoride efflux transporter CrcB [Methanohalophilus sp.]|uniref:fluoride efflux transporter CrcB n=1 Tax=Methanohalophilus sp. TaxID=1966352 RepID=UPI002633719D|nr:fluoride efflux transporter CrcB [Methanohalophilus sp.]MDK2891778.1 fluoride exporter [Methanohalophilus sp.]
MKTPLPVFYVASGGFLGTVSRYIVSACLYSPIDIFFVNVIGSFLLGLLIYYFEYAGSSSSNLKLFLGIGFMGSFTTFSTFIMQTVTMSSLSAMANVAGNVGIALLAVYIARAGTVFYQKKRWL